MILCLCLQGILVCSFLVMFLSVFGIRIILALQNELESIFSSFISWKDIVYLNNLFAPCSFSSPSGTLIMHIYIGMLNLFNGHELGQTLGDGEGQGGLACCSPWGCRESDTI